MDKQLKPDLFAAVAAAYGLPKPKTEVCFASDVMGRNWRADYVFEAGGITVAVEKEGGIFEVTREDGTKRRGAHGSVKDTLKDMQKYNAYTLLGIKLLRFTPTEMQKKPAAVCALIARALALELPPAFGLSNLADIYKTLYPTRKKRAVKTPVKRVKK